MEAEEEHGGVEKCEAYIIGGVAGIMTDGGEGRARFGVIISPRGLKGDLAERGWKVV